KQHLQGVVANLLGSRQPYRRMIAIAACAVHAVDLDVSAAIGRGQQPPSPARGRALRAAGELGRIEALDACSDVLKDDDPDCRFWGAWSAVLLGNRGRALDYLTDVARSSDLADPQRSRAIELALQAMETSAAHELLQAIAETPQQLRWLIKGSGIT